MEEHVSSILRSIGLNKAETEVYLDLVKYGASSALEISKRTKLYRSNTYDSLRRLIEKGFVKETLEENKRLFTSLDPEKIVDYLRHKEREVLGIVPAIKEFTRKKHTEEKASISHGPFSLRNVLTELLTLNKPIYVMSMSSNVEVFGEGFMEDFHKERIEKKIPLKMIYYQNNPKRAEKLNKMSYTDVKYIDCEHDFPTARIFCGDRVYLIVFENPMTAIEVRSQPLAESHIATFDFFWNASKQK